MDYFRKQKKSGDDGLREQKKERGRWIMEKRVGTMDDGRWTTEKRAGTMDYRKKSAGTMDCFFQKKKKSGDDGLLSRFETEKRSGGTMDCFFEIRDRKKSGDDGHCFCLCFAFQCIFI
jgi:hypothetical protein